MSARRFLTSSPLLPAVLAMLSGPLTVAALAANPPQSIPNGVQRQLDDCLRALGQGQCYNEEAAVEAARKVLALTETGEERIAFWDNPYKWARDKLTSFAWEKIWQRSVGDKLGDWIAEVSGWIKDKVEPFQDEDKGSTNITDEK